jgi:glycosyltransferase involved in cell wall biosynthesis
MPTSWYQAIPSIMNEVIVESPKSILDIGIGFGKYGVLFREILDIPFGRYEKSTWQTKIDGVEAFKNYKNPIYEYVYDKIYYDTIENVLTSLDNYDIITLIDVLEHFEKDKGHYILQELLNHTNKSLILSTPILPDKQEEYNGNTFEAHKSKWNVTDFVNFQMDFTLLDISGNKALIVKLYPNQKRVDKNSDIFLKDSILLEDHVISTELSVEDLNKKNKLRIAYAMPHNKLTGGLKMLVEQIKWLKSRGHEVHVYMKGSENEASALPVWNNVNVDKNIVIPAGEQFDKYIKDCDIIIAGFFDQLPELFKCNIPVMYWEQGNEWIFGDKNAGLTPYIHKMMDTMYTTPCILSSVSNFVADVFENRYGRKTAVIPNGIDTDTFFPGTPPDENVILLVGNPNLPFKGFDIALRALDLVWNTGIRFKVNWVTPVAAAVGGVRFPLQFTINPSQKELPECYRHADIFLYTSWYEGFGMPPLEAMASGVPVVCTDCGGPSMYLKSLHNALVSDTGDYKSLAAEVAYLLQNKNVREVLSSNGRQTALDFTYEKTYIKLEYLLYRIKTCF